MLRISRVDQLALVYLAFPVGLFVVGWLKAIWWIPLLFLLGVGLYEAVKRGTGDRTDLVLSRHDLILAAIVLLVWLMLSGAGDLAYQNRDWEKHMALFRDLIAHDWPIAYAVGHLNDPIRLVYALAFYLPTALVGKVLGFDAAMAFCIVWTMIGIVLAFLLFVALVGRYSVVLLAIFVLFSGLDVIGYLVVNGRLPQPDAHLEWWAGHWQFSGNTTLLFWVPQHALAGWLGAGLLLRDCERADPARCGFVVALVVLWSPFVALGLLPFAMYLCLRHGASRAISRPNLAAVPLGALVGGFLLSALPEPHRAVMFLPQVLAQTYPVLLLFLVLEVGVFSIWLYGREAARNWFAPVFWLSQVMLLVCLSYRFGLYNDFAMRLSIPALFVLQVAVARRLERPRSMVVTGGLGGALLLGFVSSTFEINRSLNTLGDAPRWPPASMLHQTPERARQYLARPDSRFLPLFVGTDEPARVEVTEPVRRMLASEGFR